MFAIAMYGIGYMGFKQKAINPTYELAELKETDIITAGTALNLSQQIILDKLLAEFEKEKIHLNSSLNINDVVQKVGTNRTYISAIINQQYNQNFCSFVNSFRLEELERIFTANPSLSNQVLAEQSGFGSFNSMKRAIASRTGQSLSEWKKNVMEGNLSVG
jgi:AraC-like DNA-binding protein